MEANTCWLHTRITHRHEMKCIRLTHTHRETYLCKARVFMYILSFMYSGLQLLQDPSTAGQSPSQTSKLPPSWTQTWHTFNIHSWLHWYTLTFIKYIWITCTFGGVIFNWLFECCDVTKRTQEEHNLLLFISYRRYFHKKPHRRSWKNKTMHIWTCCKFLIFNMSEKKKSYFSI